MNIYLLLAWLFVGIFAVAAVVSTGVAIAAYVGWIRVDAVIAVVLAISFAGYLLAPLGYVRDRGESR